MSEATADRAIRAGLGALAGLGLWAVGERWDDTLTPAILFLTMLALVFSSTFLLLFERGHFRPAVLGALGIALPVALLTAWASLRYNTPIGLVRSGYPLVAAFLMAALPVPFLIAARRPDGDWRHYPTLFTVSWALVLKSLASMIFVGIVLAVLALGGELLRLVDIRLLEQLMREDIAVLLINGAAFGIGLAMLEELVDLQVPRLVLRLLRLLLPVTAVLVVLFLLGLPFRGLSALFGGRSTAAVLMAIAIGAIGLISVAAAEDDGEAVKGRTLGLSARALAALLPVVAVLAGWAIWLRVAEYGWTPDRIAAATGAVIVAGYGVFYGWMALRGGDWLAGIRQANVGMALALVAIAALWLSPLLDTGGISVKSQVARFDPGKDKLEDLPVYELLNEWGPGGPVALDGLIAALPEAEAKRLGDAVATAGQDRYDLRRILTREARGQEFAELSAKAIIRPEGASLPAWLSAEQSQWTLGEWGRACAREVRPGLAGCAFVLADFLPSLPGDEVMVFLNAEGPSVGSSELKYSVEGWDPSRGGFRVSYEPTSSRPDLPVETVFEVITDGTFRTGPVTAQSLFIGESEFAPLP
ncbi:MAG: DUF4153 domain-containing protein [Rhodobacteraceae bacterium]|nr:DUF4153 domain-containing protein [Paracoccaceae bacterium]